MEVAGGGFQRRQHDLVGQIGVRPGQGRRFKRLFAVSGGELFAAGLIDARQVLRHLTPESRVVRQPFPQVAYMRHHLLPPEQRSLVADQVSAGFLFQGLWFLLCSRIRRHQTSSVQGRLYGMFRSRPLPQQGRAVQCRPADTETRRMRR